MVNDLIPMTYDEIRNLRGMARYNAIEVHKEWLKRQRKQDKKELRSIMHKEFVIWWRKNDPEGYARYHHEAYKRYQEKLKSNPKKYAQYQKKMRKRNKLMYQQLKNDPVKYQEFLAYYRKRNAQKKY